MNGHSPQQPDRSILIVEDDEAIGEVLLLTIQQETNFHAIWIKDGLEAMRHIQEHQPALLIVNYLLPGMNGLDLADYLRSKEDYQHIPILIVSANVPQQEVEKRQLTVIRKPFELDEILKLIQREINLSTRKENTRSEDEKPT